MSRCNICAWCVDRAAAILCLPQICADETKWLPLQDVPHGLLVAMGNKMFPEAVLIDEADMLFDGLKVSTSLFLRLSRR